VCLPDRLRHPKTRWMMVFSNCSLAAAILLLDFMRHHPGERPWLDGFTGLFFGISIGVNFFGVRHARRALCGGGDESNDLRS